MYEDKVLKCRDCGEEFVFTAGEQEFYAEKGLKSQREYFTTVCAECGKEAKVPFEPTNDRPVYCSECYAAKRQ